MMGGIAFNITIIFCFCLLHFVQCCEAAFYGDYNNGTTLLLPKLHSHHNHTARQVINLSESTCSKTLGEHGTDRCLAVRLRLPRFEEKLVLDAIEEEDANPLVRRVYIDTHELHSNTVNKVLDKVLLSRPWWIIRKEPYDWMVAVNHASVDSLGHSNLTFHVYLQRYRSDFEPLLRVFASVQFPPGEAECGTSHLLLGHMVNSGWGSALSTYGSYMTSHPWVIFSTYDTNSNLPSEPVMYASPDLCPQHLNKWLCAFLQPTNCTLPAEVTQCTLGPACWPSGFPYFTNSTSTGTRIEDAMVSQIPALRPHMQPTSQYHMDVAKRFAGEGQKYLNQRLTHEPYYDALGKLRDDRTPDTLTVLRVFGLLTRLNGVYRSLVAQRVQRVFEYAKSRGLPALEPGVPCTTVHIRRGDRTYDGVDMNEFCRNHTRHGNDFGNCTNKYTGEAHSCLDLQDKGCFGVRPFGGIPLQEYLDRAYKLHPTHNLFIMTDADDWLREEQMKIDPIWKLYSISSHGHLDRLHTSANATRNGVDFYASLRLAQQCQAFVGHAGSAVTLIVLQAMCFAHHLNFAVCPTAVDIGGNTGYRF